MNKKGFGVLIAVLVVLLIVVTVAAGWGVWQLRQIEKEISGADLTEELSAAPTTTSTTEDATSKPTTTVKQIEDPGITWTVPPTELADQPIFNDDAIKTIGDEKIRYYKIGTTDSGSEILLSLFPENGMGASYRTFRFFKDQNNKISFIADSSDSDRDLLENNDPIFKTEVNYDSTKFRSVTAPEFLDYSDEVLEKTSTPYSVEPKDFIYQESSELVKANLTEYGQIFIKEVKSDEYKSTSRQQLVLRLADYSLQYYIVKSKFITDNEIPIVTWSDGTKNTIAYSKGGLGGSCGTFGVWEAVAIDASASRFTEAGTTSVGLKIYVPKETSDLLFKDAYKNYSVGRVASEGTSGGQVALAENVFVTKKPIFLYKDGIGRYILFNNSAFSPLAECGKPVIYLYPEKKTNVSVKVGANITVSEPEYNDGWLTTADPSGQLKVGGNSYDSLFWEGQGLGEYPVINSGFVVETKNIEVTLKNHLAQLGLNSKELTDFMAFWLPKMPTTKYTRLTWFGTRQMDKLAPLTISPQPDTSIRIFLDYQGLDKPIDLPEQKLSSIDRKGFTLVEWGGLLVK